MDFIVELIIEILGDIAESVMKSKKAPRWVRVLVYLIMAITLSALVFFVAYIVYEPLSVWRTVLAFVLAVGIVVFDVWGFISVWNDQKRKNNAEDETEIKE